MTPETCLVHCRILSYNRLQCIQPNTFANLKNLRILWVPSHILLVIPSEVSSTERQTIATISQHIVPNFLPSRQWISACLFWKRNICHDKHVLLALQTGLFTGMTCLPFRTVLSRMSSNYPTCKYPLNQLSPKIETKAPSTSTTFCGIPSSATQATCGYISLNNNRQYQTSGSFVFFSCSVRWVETHCTATATSSGCPTG